MGNPTAGEFKPGEKDPEVTEKWAAALSLRKSGASFDQIAKEVGYASPSGAYQAVMNALHATLREPAESVRVLEVERLDRLMAGVWKQAEAGDPDCIDRVLKIMDRRAKLLGLDAPQKIDLEDGRKEYDLANPPTEL